MIVSLHPARMEEPVWMIMVATHANVQISGLVTDVQVSAILPYIDEQFGNNSGCFLESSFYLGHLTPFVIRV